jgi:hypothetical protein
MLSLLPRPNRKEGIDTSDYLAAADALSVPVSRIRAVDVVESAGSGFLPSGRPKILFEGHIFSKLTHGRYSKAYPTVSYPEWTTAHYLGGEKEYKRLERAMQLDPIAALKSASWGRFQILGDNYKACGFNTVEEYVAAMFLDEDNHLEAFVAYIKSAGLADELQRGDFAAFARKYNGPLYKRNHYDTKMANADKRFAATKFNRQALASTPPRIEAVFPADCLELCVGVNNTSLDDRYNSSLASPANPPASDDQTGPTGQQPNTLSIPADNAGGDARTSLSDSLPSFDNLANKASDVQNKVDVVNNIISRKDGIKALLETVLNLVKRAKALVKQIVVFIVSWFFGLSWEEWAILAVAAMAVYLVYVYRNQIIEYVDKKIRPADRK